MPPPDLADRLWQVADRALQQGAEIRVDDLAEYTGVPRATLYYYFSGKDDLLAFLLSQTLERGTEAVAQAAASEGSAVERLEAVLRAMLETMAEHPALCTRLMGGITNGANATQVMADVERSLMRPVRDLLVEATASGELVVPDVTDTTLVLMGAVSTVAMVRTASGTFNPDEAAKNLVPQLLNGLRPRD
jgi:TetR/AcrR family transcriptional regulator